jgi:hypothetical protein
MTARLDVLPGDTIPHEHIPSSSQKKLKLGPGLAHIPPSTIKATVAGTLHADFQKNALWLEYNGGRVSKSKSHPPQPSRSPIPFPAQHRTPPQSAPFLTSKTSPVRTTPNRPRRRHNPPLRPRHLPRLPNPLHPHRHPPPPLLRVRHKKDPPPTRRRRRRLRPHRLRLERPRHGAGMRASDDGQGRGTRPAQGWHGV